MALRIDPALLTEHFTRSSGPGGQNVNKVATAVELRFDFGRSSLSDEVKARLRALGGSRVLDDDVLVVEAHEFRTQGRNREAARERLVALLEKAARKPRPRRKTKPTAKARQARIDAKHRRGALKKRRTAPIEE